MSDGQVVLVTGASSGIGAAIAECLAGAGYRVFGTTRGAASQTLLQMDVRDSTSIAACVGTVLKQAGRIDALVNNAGYGIAAAVENTSPDDMARQLDTNFLGPLRVCQAVLPVMRAQRSGRIVQISSLAARIGIPFQGAYSASKAALEGMSEALSIELAPFGILVVIIQPGDTKTGFTAARQWTAAAQADVTYAERARYAIGVMEKAEQAGTPAAAVAQLVLRALREKAPKLHYVSASGSERLALTLQRLLPGRMFERLIASNYERRVPR